MSVEDEALALLRQFAAPGWSDEERLRRMLELRPHAGDAERVFLPELAARAEAVYAPVWEAPPLLQAEPGQTEVLLALAPAESVGPSLGFPGGYRRVAHLLRPGFLWLAWSFVVPGENVGLSFDGLVRIDERFAWFPRPWKLLD
jgi:hypothetical protein